MVVAKRSLVKLVLSITALGFLGTGMIVHAANVLNASETDAIIGCQLNVYRDVLKQFGTPEIYAMYTGCIEECVDSHPLLISLGCKITTCLHLISAYTTAQGEALIRGKFHDGVTTLCPVSPVSVS